MTKKGTHKRQTSYLTGKPRAHRLTGTVSYKHTAGKTKLKTMTHKTRISPHSVQRVRNVYLNKKGNKFRTEKSYSKTRYVGRKIRRG